MRKANGQPSGEALEVMLAHVEHHRPNVVVLEQLRDEDVHRDPVVHVHLLHRAEDLETPNSHR